MSKDESAEAKGRAAVEARKRRLSFLQRRIPELQRAGVPGRKAREQADREYRG